MASATTHPERTFVSLGTKIVLSLVFVLAISAVVTAYQLSHQTRERLVEGKVTAAGMVVELFAASVLPALDFGDEDSLRTEVEKLGSNADIAYASVFRPGETEPVAELARPRERRASPPTGDGTVIGDERIDVTRILSSRGGAVLGTLVVRVSLAPENERFRVARRNIVLFAALSTLLAALVVTAISRRLVVRPLGRLSEAALLLEGGKATQVEVGAHDEVGRLATAFNSMASAIVDRERRLAALNREQQQLLDNMRQAILVFGPDGRIAATRSRRAQVLFPALDAPGLTVQQLLYPGAGHDVAAEAFHEWVAAAFSVPSEAWSEVEELAPTEVTLGRGETERVLALDFRPVAMAGKVEKVMLLATDETEKRVLERTVKEKDEVHEKQMAALRRLVAGGGQLLVSVIERARRRMETCQALVTEAGGPLEPALVAQLFQHVHSVKGEARAFDLSALEAAAAELEDYLAILRGRLREGIPQTVEAVRGDVLLRIDTTRWAVTGASDMLVAASPIGAAILEQVTVQRGDVEGLTALVGDRTDEIGLLVTRLSSRPLGELLLGLAEAVPRWAASEGKRVRLEVEGKDVLVPRRLADVLPGVLTHLLRNAVVHGVESAAVRSAAGKEETALVHILAESGPGGPTLTVEDDGRGLDAEAISERARALGLPGDQAAATAVFADGLSTSQEVGGLAGRGVGLAAVRADLATIGYAITLHSTDRGLRIRILSETHGGPEQGSQKGMA